MSVDTGHGGYRRPTNPAVVSGPGAHSARTDGGVMDPNAPAYGEGVELENLAAAASMGGGGGAAGGGAPADPFAALVGLSAPRQTDLPVTAGAAAGAGPGPEALGLPRDPFEEKRADARSLDPAMVNTLVAAASNPDATPSFKRLVREVIASM